MQVPRFHYHGPIWVKTPRQLIFDHTIWGDISDWEYARLIREMSVPPPRPHLSVRAENAHSGLPEPLRGISDDDLDLFLDE